VSLCFLGGERKCSSSDNLAASKTQNAHHPAATYSILTQIKMQDEVTRYRSVLRSQFLFNKNHSVTHNIITGEARHNTAIVPPAPLPPQMGQGSTSH